MAQQVSWQEYQSLQIRASAILTNAYVAGTVLGAATNDANQVKTNDHIEQINHLSLECAFTIGSLTSVSIKVEFSEDNVTYYQLQSGTFATGIDTMTPAVFSLAATGNYLVDINKEFFNGGGFKTRYIKVSSSGVGTVTSSALSINAVYGVC